MPIFTLFNHTNRIPKMQATAKTITPSPLQTNIYNVVETTDSNMIVNAVAGSGKTTTIVEIARRIPTHKRSIFLAFNKDIVKELKGKLPPHIEVKTIHSFGLNELRFKFGRNPLVTQETFIDNSKISKIIMALAPSWAPFSTDPEQEEADKLSYCSRVERIVDLARMCMPQSREEMITLCEKFDVQLLNGEIDRAKEVLRAANKINTSFDFTDMIYRAAIGDWKLKQYDFVIIDECQDFNRTQQMIVKRIVKPGGRMIAVGDPRQAIYGFAGADSDSFNNLKSMFPNTVEMPLSVCYRCDQTIIDHAQEIVPYITARPGAGSGEMRQGSVKEIQDGDFVLCRNTRPLVSLCLSFIAQGRKATIKGGDIGKNLINIIKNTKMKGVEPMFNKLDREYQKLIAKARIQYPLKPADEVSYVASMDDKIEALRSISTGCAGTSDMIDKIGQIFTDDVYGIVLSTVHKSKGLEADNVFIVERFRMPAPFATQAWEREQEANLDYVARTRTRHKLIYVNDWVSDEEKRKNLVASLTDIPKQEEPATTK